MKRLYRNKDNKVFCGVIGGFGEYFGVDPVILRVGYVFLSVFTGIAPGLIAYFIVCMIVPEK
ncbi:MAG: PspC domain-containing protein [Patescibacteria group bacterium]